ncbi:anti sigma-E protein, RseA [Pseudogulbenkiania sp. NH8B]|uniref:sigma-E factor negative regulatory protein n=1 Tax=Pseudogulbenkiania sp. (strain NH8B) TaxID=748280 RepID=UPI0002279B2D|nr:sigma-E factor negative regulatory protein [Pseudogulbenkiania sp. NH8B]BAK76394.1 anti sigma-E protein, RseA [Pseudogulbenkiania sp. NH8B]
MKESLSALVDNELDGPEASKLISAASTDESLKEAWDEYHLIGDAMRASGLNSINVRHSVAARLAEEPTVLAPRRWLRQGSVRTVGAVALAASMSFAAVVAWQQLAVNGQGAAMVAEKGVPVQVAQQVEPANGPMARDNGADPYLLAHQEMASDPDVVKVSLGNGVRH